jgi:hypothetical protein
LRLFAIFMWLAAAYWLFVYAWISNDARFESRGFIRSHVYVVLVMFTLPACGLFLLGLSCWWRTWWLAAVGILSLAPAVISFVWAFSGTI